MFRIIILALALFGLMPTAHGQMLVRQCWDYDSVTTPTRPNCVQSMIPATMTTSGTSLIIKSTPGVIHRLQATNNTSTAGYVILMDATSVPADGTITPTACMAVGANSAVGNSIDINYGEIGAKMLNGIVAFFSTAASCYTKTTGATAGFISGMYR